QRPALYLRLVRQRRARPNGGADCRRRAGAACRGAGAPGCDATRRTASRYGEAQANAVRRHTEVSYGAKSWKCQRRVAARIEATPKGLDIRYVVTNLA